MREYFSQFGQVNKIRMSRNKATGQSKHFAVCTDILYSIFFAIC
jgi:RNA recognition motif-containing protein